MISNLSSDWQINLTLTCTDEQFASLRVRHKDAIWVLFLASETERAILEALSAGASAILPPSANLAEIIATIRMVADRVGRLPAKTLSGPVRQS